MTLIRSPKELWTGLLYIGFASVAYWVGAAYRMGTADRMGPGYFPRVLAVLLFCVGAAAIARAFIIRGEPIGRLAIGPLVVVSIACVGFGWLLNRAGLFVALTFLMIVSASASMAFRLHGRAILGLVAVLAFCALIFVKGLGIPMPIFGTWLQPTLEPWLEPVEKQVIDPLWRSLVTLVQTIRSWF